MSQVIALEIVVVDEWHAGTGRGAGPDLDAGIAKTDEGLPYLPGRTLKGLLREAVETAEAAGVIDAAAQRSASWFGTPLPPDAAAAANDREADDRRLGMLEEARFVTQEGWLAVGNAEIGGSAQSRSAWRGWARENRAATRWLTRRVATTRIEGGVAASKSLRTTEVAVPMTLHAVVSGPDGTWPDELERALLFVEGVGSFRTRGFGRCRVRRARWEVVDADHGSDLTPVPEKGPWRVRYRMELESDVALSRKNATLGGHETLEYIPGGAFQGALARLLGPDGLARFDRPGEESGWTFFGSGRVRVGDATPLRSFRVPRCIQREKHTAAAPENRIFCDIDDRQMQAVQAEWMTYHDAAPTPVRVKRHGSLRTAIGASGRVRKGMLFEIDSIARGTVLEGTIELDAEVPLHAVVGLVESLHGALVRLGRSSSAEYGAARVEVDGVDRIEADVATEEVEQAAVLCLSDVAFVDVNGLPTTEPTAALLGFPGDCAIDWQRSAVRFRSYSPFRNRRATVSPGAEAYRLRPGEQRTVVEAGSVYVVCRAEGRRILPDEITAARASTSRGVGRFRAEGLGCLAICPDVLRQEQYPGLAARPVPAAPLPGPAMPLDADPLYLWLGDRQTAEGLRTKAWDLADKWLRDARGSSSRLPPAQWGRLRAWLDTKPARDASFTASLKAFLGGAEEQESADPTTRKPRGQGAGNLRWRSDFRKGKSWMDWMVERVEADATDNPAVARAALRLFAQSIVRAQRSKENG